MIIIVYIEHKFWLTRCNKFMNEKVHPHEFIFVAEYGLSKYEDVSFQGKVKRREVVIHNTIIEMRNDLVSSLKYIAPEYDFIKNHLMNKQAFESHRDEILKSIKHHSAESDSS